MNDENTPIPGWKPAYLLLIDRVKGLVERLRYNKVVHNGFKVFTKGGMVFLQHWQVLDRKMEVGRKWVLSEHMVDSEILQTALMAILAFEEHEAREALTFDGRRLYGPHRSLVNLEKECEYRDQKVEPKTEQPVEATGQGLYRFGTSSVRDEALYPWLEQGSKNYEMDWFCSTKPIGVDYPT